MSADPDLLALWTTGWALTRGVAAPVWDDGGWRIEVGAEDQVRRLVFSDIGPAVARHGDRIRETAILLKICSEPETVRPLLPARWSVARSGWMMGLTGRMCSSRSIAPGYDIQVRREGDVIVCVLVDEAGTQAAQGRAVKVADHIIYDRIVVEPLHQRRGLGGCLMRTLETHAGSSGRGLLVATDSGRGLYETLGWAMQSPYATAAIA